MTRVGPPLAVLAGTIGLVVFATLLPAPIAVAWPVRLAIFGVGSAALWLGLLCAIGAQETIALFGPSRTRRLFASLERGAQRAWPSGLALALLPLERWLPQAFVAADGVLFTLAWVGLSVVELHCVNQSADAAAQLEATRRPGANPKLGGWEVCAFVFCVCVTAWFVVIALNAHGTNDNDAAYYFGVARHIVKTGRFEEPIVWHYLVSPPSVNHVPFDYWQGLTSLVLVPALWVFGPTMRVALVTMALIDGLGLVLLWYLIAIAAPFRHRVAQASALLLFAASPAMALYRFDTESVPVFQAVLLAALIALARKRLLLAACLGFLLYLTRGDGSISCGLLWTALLISLLRGPRENAERSVRPLLATMTLLLAMHVASCLALYGTPVPPGTSAGASLRSYSQLYRVEDHATPFAWGARLGPTAVADEIWHAWDTLRTIPFLPLQPLFLGAMLAIGYRRPDWPLTRLVWLLVVAGSGAIAVGAGVMFAPPWRSLHTMAPLMVLAAGATIDYLLEWLGTWQRASWLPRPIVFAACASVLLAPSAALTALRPHGMGPSEIGVSPESNVRALAPMLTGEVVASTQPFFVIALTDSPAIMIPDGDVATLERLFRKYHVQWLLLSKGACLGQAEPICDAILSDRQKSLGGLRLVRAKAAGEFVLFRVTDMLRTPPARLDALRPRSGLLFKP